MRKNGQYLPTEGTGDGQNGNRGDEGRDNKRKFRNSKYDFEDKKDEESDTEDSCELEITPEQLSQVVPGGGVLKIKLSKKKPIKITAGAPNGEPDPAQTKVKTIHDPINRRNGQPISNPKSGVVVGVWQSVEKKIPLGEIRQSMLRVSRRERPNIPPEGMGRSNGDDNGTSNGNGDSHDHDNSPNGIKDLVGVETLQIGEEEDLLEKMEIQMEEMEFLTLMIVGMGMILHPQQILLLPEGEGIENLNMFMYYKDLQDHEARKGNLDMQEEMAEMVKHCH